MYSHPYVYLDHKAISDQGLDQAEVADAVAKELMGFRGIALAVSSSALRTNRLPDTLLMRAVLRNYHRKRSGDIFIVFEPNVFINDMDGLTVASTHGSPWRYDTHVPIFFAGFGVEHGVVHRPVTPYDIASTLTAVLGSKPTSGAIGQPLPEVVDR